jgi:hypothetical protein
MPQPPLPRAFDPPNPRSWLYRRSGPKLQHYALRFLLSLRPGGPSAASEEWVRGFLSPAELSLFEALPGFDRRHAIGAARLVLRVTGDRLATRAMLLHDVGKIDCGLGPLGRSAATIVARVFPTLHQSWCHRWWLLASVAPGGRARPRGVRQRFASYWLHPWIGRRILEAAGAPPQVAGWAEQHHHPYLADDLVFAWETACILWEADFD